MPDLSNLIARLESASGPDRRLDAEIACAMMFSDLRPAGPDDHKEYQRGIPPGRGDIWCPTGFLMADTYTSSIESARSIGGLLVFASEIGADGLPMVKLVTDTSTTPIVEYTGIAATLPLAWCVAALKARQSSNTARHGVAG